MDDADPIAYGLSVTLADAQLPACPKCRSANTERLPFDSSQFVAVYPCVECGHVWRVPSEPLTEQRARGSHDIDG